jgi:hypothetical protein
MVWNDTINVMRHEKWASFTTRPLPPLGSSEVMVAVSLDNNSKDATP